MNRRKFFTTSAAGAAGLGTLSQAARADTSPFPAFDGSLSSNGVAGGLEGLNPKTTRLRRARFQRFLNTDLIKDKVKLESLRVLTRDGEYFIEARDTDGAVGIAMGHPKRLGQTYPITVKRIAKFYEGKDMRDYEQHLDDLYIYDSTYKWQGLPMWVNVAFSEIAILDLIGRKFGVPIHALIGSQVRDSIGIYYANGDRNHSAQWVVDKQLANIAESGAKAVKFKLGARMAMTEQSNKRDTELIPLMREALGPEYVIYADANGSYDVPTAIHFGKMMEEYDYGFLEEPVPWDYLDENKAVADAIDIPMAGGEQESSLWAFEWQIANNVLQIVQPDLIYFGGMIRAMRVAAMAKEAGIVVVPHISSRGLGSLYMHHFTCTLSNTTDFQEYKGDADPIPYEVTGTEQRFKAVDGRLPVLQGPGLGITIDPDYLKTLKDAPV